MRPPGAAARGRLRRRSRRLDAAALSALSPMLILAPHQDDETLGCGGLIASAAAQGLGPRIAYLTDGAGSHQGSPTWPASRLAAVRRREALDALGVLGVPPHDVRFLDWPDAAPASQGDPIWEEAMTSLLGWARGRPPRSIWATWQGEPHCDHEAAARLADSLAAALPRTPRRMDYIIWGWSEPALTDRSRRAWSLDCAGVSRVRRRALARHRTQTTGVIDDAAQSFRMPPDIAALASCPSEIYLERS